MIYSYKELLVWQKGMDLVVNIYNFTEYYPKSELYGLTGQTRRASVSFPSNIAEGRGTRKDFANYLRISLGSANELETQIELAIRLKYVEKSYTEKAEKLLSEIIPMLKSMISKLKENNEK